MAEVRLEEIAARYRVVELRRLADFEMQIVATKSGRLDDDTRVSYVVSTAREYSIGDIVDVVVARIVDDGE